MGIKSIALDTYLSTLLWKWVGLVKKLVGELCCVSSWEWVY